MELIRHYEIEGLGLDIPLVYDTLSHMYLEMYPDFVEHPAYTPGGQPIYFTGEDACPLARAADGGECLDCGSCRYYRQAPGTLIGVCGHEQKRKIRQE